MSRADSGVAKVDEPGRAVLREAAQWLVRLHSVSSSEE